MKLPYSPQVLEIGAGPPEAVLVTFKVDVAEEDITEADVADWDMVEEEVVEEDALVVDAVLWPL